MANMRMAKRAAARLVSGTMAFHDGLEHHLKPGQQGKQGRSGGQWAEQEEGYGGDRTARAWAGRGWRVLGQAWSNERSRGQRTELGPPSGGQTGSGGSGTEQ